MMFRRGARIGRQPLGDRPRWTSTKVAALLILLALALPFVQACEADRAPHPGLLDPALANEQAPERFRVQFETTQGKVVFEVNRAWGPNGADRFYNLVRVGFFEDVGMIRVINDFMAQFGLHGEPRVARAWKNARIQDDPRIESNVKGTLAFAKRPERHSRTTQLFVNFRDNKNLDQVGFVPIGRVVSGMEVFDRIYRTGEGAPGGPGPSQQRIEIVGNAYLRESFPELDYIVSASLLD